MANIPGLTLSGGKLSNFGGHSAVKEYRVWARAKKGDSYETVWYTAKTFEGAKGVYKRAKARGENPEKPVAVVFDANKQKYREVVIDAKAANARPLRVKAPKFKRPKMPSRTTLIRYGKIHYAKGGGLTRRCGA